MKTTQKLVLVLGLSSLATLTAVAGPSVSVQVGVPPPPVVKVSVPVPAPAVTVSVGVPETYVWDGFEYVGVIGDDYFYLGPGHVWILCEPFRAARFHDWQKVHVGWRDHATVNVHYRKAANGHADYPGAAAKPADKDNRGYDHDQDHGHDH